MTAAIRRFRAMGCRSTVVVEGDGADCERLAELAMIRIARLEACWSPFLPDSDVSRLNLAGGAPIVVRPATVTLLQAMAEATIVTDGAYDPTVSGQAAENSPWIDHVAIDADAMVVQTAAGIRIDPGGIGKGLAADLVAADTMADGAAAVAVMIGGDGRVRSDDRAHRWVIEIAGPGGTTSVDRVAVSDGAIATSGFSRAHLVDPSTGGLCEAADVVQVSVLAGTGESAEALTKAVLVGGEPGHRRSARSSGCRRARRTRRWSPVGQRDVDSCIATVTRRGGGVNEQIWWYLARSAGMAAAVLMVGALVLGVLAATRALKDIDRPAWLVALHRWFSVLTVVAVVTHLVALVADSYVHFGLAELLVPGTSSWRPFAVSLGVIALYLFAVVHVSSLAMKRLPKVWWRRLHALSYLSVWAAIMHAGTAGTDTTNVVYRAVAMVLTIAAVTAVLLRVILGRYAARAAAARRSSTGEAEGGERRRPRPARRVDEVEVVVAVDVDDRDVARRRPCTRRGQRRRRSRERP